MKKRTKPLAKSSRALEEAHQIAKGLYRIGLIDKHKMRKYDALCLKPIQQYSSRQIKLLRAKHNISQAVLATIMNMSLSTIRQWEIGDKRPSGASLKLLNILDTKGIEVFINGKKESGKQGDRAF